MTIRRRPGLKAIAAIVALVLFGLTMASLVIVIDTANQQVAMLGGCPSTLFPVEPGSRLHQYAVITAWPSASGCWQTYDQPSSATAAEVFAYYEDPSHTDGWTVQEEYAQTQYAAFINARDSTIHVDVEVSTLRTLLVAGAPYVRLDISICRCDPRTMAQ